MTLASSVTALARLAALVSGLIFVSEADHELTVLRLGALPKLEPEPVLRALGKPADSRFEIVSVSDFFAPALREHAFHSAEERAVVARYRALVEYLTMQLAGACVLRVGAIKIDVYAVGRTSDHDWVGVATQVVET